MPAQWTAELIGKMHMYGITAKQLAEEVNWNPKYLSVILNGHRKTKNGERILREALDNMIQIKTNQEEVHTT